MLDDLDRTIFDVTYQQIEASSEKRVAGSAVWEKARMIYPNLAPVTVPARLRRLVSEGLLEKDAANSSCRATIYGPTEAGYKMWQSIMSNLLK